MMKKVLSTPRIIVSLIILVPLLVIALLGHLFTPYDPLEIDYSAVLQSPSSTHPLGTDEFGRDLLSRMIVGIRPTLVIAFSSTAIAFFAGIVLGMAAGYFSGPVEQLIMRMMDILLCFPPSLLALMAVGFWGTGERILIVVMSLIYTPQFARIAHSSTLQVKKMEYVENEISLGASHFRTIWNSVLPNIMSPMIIQTSLTVAAAILLESGLSFLGLGVIPPNASWGQMIGTAKGYIYNSPTYVLWPSLCLCVTILAVNLLGDGLRDVLDPKLHRSI